MQAMGRLLPKYSQASLIASQAGLLKLYAPVT
jgi:hypothetical protein